MKSFYETNQIRLKLKMALSQYAWYKASHIVSSDDGFVIVISITHLDNNVRKLISPVFNNVSVKTEVEQKKRK